MTVEFVPNNQKCIEMGISNGTWFWLLDNTDIGKLVNSNHTNDIINADQEISLKCAKIMKDTTFPDTWGIGIGSSKLQSYFIEFFETCEGFTTY